MTMIPTIAPTPIIISGSMIDVSEAIELWQHGDDRVHDRFRFTREGAGWRRERLAP